MSRITTESTVTKIHLTGRPDDREIVVYPKYRLAGGEVLLRLHKTQDGERTHLGAMFTTPSDLRDLADAIEAAQGA